MDSSAAKNSESTLTNNSELIADYVTRERSRAFGVAGGALPFPYLKPAGFYSQLWDWDAVYMGVGLVGRQPDALKHFEGSMLNFLTLCKPDGSVPGCLTNNGSSTTLLHAKPVIIWGSYLAAKAGGSFGVFEDHASKMEALLAYWDTPPRLDRATGLHVWYDVMECGADDLPWTPLPSAHTPGWSVKEHSYTISAPDVMMFLHMEHTAYAAFLHEWDAERHAGKIAHHTQRAAEIRDALNAHLWHWEDEAAGRGWCVRACWLLDAKACFSVQEVVCVCVCVCGLYARV